MHSKPPAKHNKIEAALNKEYMPELTVKSASEMFAIAFPKQILIHNLSKTEKGNPPAALIH